MTSTAVTPTHTAISMRTKTRIIATTAVLGALAFAAPAAAHPGHASCSDAAHSFIVPLAQSGQAGEVASGQAKAGTIDETLAAAHAALCAPK